jgi:hypothetical protein
MKIKILIDDPETRAVWETAQRAKVEVAAWPAWKRGDQPETPAASSASAQPRHATTNTDS